MKFKFLGNFDCPEWVITEITYLTKITPVKLRILGNHISKYILGEADLGKALKMLEEMNLSEKEAKIVISLLVFIIKNGAKFDAKENILSQELQQLGMPQDNAESLSKVFGKNKEKIREYLKSAIFSFNEISDINYKISYILSDNFEDFKCQNMKENENMEDNYVIDNIDKKVVSLIINLKNGKEMKLNINKEILGELIKDLQTCSKAIKKMKGDE